VILILKKTIKIILIISYTALIISVLVFARDLSVQQLLTYTPHNKLMAAVFLLGMFALKSISVFFPIVVLQIASGFLFPPLPALLVNIIGTSIAYSIPYFIGRFSGAEAAKRKITQNPNIAQIFEKQHKHEFFISFFLRVVSCLPSDLISMYLGALKFNFSTYLTASILGTLPGLIPATFMGDSITKPLSPQFMISLLITIISSLLSLLIYYFYNKKNR